MNSLAGLHGQGSGMLFLCAFNMKRLGFHTALKASKDKKKALPGPQLGANSRPSLHIPLTWPRPQGIQTLIRPQQLPDKQEKR